MYSLRSRRKVHDKDDLLQTKLDLPVRKRRQSSPCKREEKCKDKINDVDKFDNLKSAFHGFPTEQITCREKEIDQLQSFLLRCINNHRPGSLYVSGPPGTGKTATIMYLLDQHKELMNDTHVVSINCLTTSQSIYKKIASELGIKEKLLPEHIISNQSMILLVLDEIDQCRQQSLYTLFEWPTLTGSCVILIGIANSLDLTDRVLPRLQTRPQTTPELLIFNPYTKEEIVSILQSRLDTVPDGSSLVEKTALQFCARKVAAVSGDVRQALDISQRAIEFVQTRAIKKEDSKDSLKVTISDISTVLEDVYGGTSASKNVTEKLPLHQKLVVCSVIVATRTKSSKEIPLGKLYNVYEQICEKQKLHHESQKDFMSLLDMLEVQGIITIKRGKETLLHKVSLQYQESELTHLLSDQGLLSSVLGL